MLRTNAICMCQYNCQKFNFSQGNLPFIHTQTYKAPISKIFKGVMWDKTVMLQGPNSNA